MKDFSFISDTINETLLECGVLMFSFKENKRDIVRHDGKTMSVSLTLTDTFTHLHTHRLPP